MLNFNVKQIGYSTDINDPLSLGVVEIPVNEWWSMSVRKSALPNCKLKLITIKNFSLDDISCYCGEDANIKSDANCIYSVENDDRAYLSLTILDKTDIPAFKILVDENEILEFDGGSIDELIMLGNSAQLGVEELGYGIRFYFDRSYNGKLAEISGTTDVYLLNDVFCLNKSDYVGINFAFCETGCYRLGFVKGDEIVAISNQFNVVKKAKKNTHIIEYYQNGFYHRHRIFLTLNNPKYIIEEEQKTLSSGDLSVKNVIIRTQQDFYTELMPHDEHLKLVSIFKKDFKLAGQKCIMIGGYSNDQEGFYNTSIGNGTLNFSDDTIKSIDQCGEGCESGSIFRFEVYEYEKYQTIIA